MAVINKIVNPRSGGGTATTDASELTAGILANARLGTGIPVDKLGDGSISDEELGYLDGLANDIVTLLAGKSDVAHTHSLDDTTESLSKKHFSLTEKNKLDNIATEATKNIILTGNATLTGVTALDYVEVATTITVTGAVITDVVDCSIDLARQDGSFSHRASVTSANTVTYYCSYNDTEQGTIDVSSNVVRVRIVR